MPGFAISPAVLHRKEKARRRERLERERAHREAIFEAAREYLDVSPAVRAARHLDLARRLRALGHSRAIAAAERLEAEAGALRSAS